MMTCTGLITHKAYDRDLKINRYPHGSRFFPTCFQFKADQVWIKNISGVDR